jgi:hypothetical protein
MAGTYPLVPVSGLYSTLCLTLKCKTGLVETNSDKRSSLLFAIKASNKPFEWSPVMGSTWVGSILAFKYHARVRVTDSDKHPSLL